MEDTLAFLKELTEAPGAPGYEHAVREILRPRFAQSSEVTTDNLGSLIGKQAGDTAGPKVMVAGHMDEVAFMVTLITDEGFIKFQTLGGWWEQVMLAQRVIIKGSKGDVPGVIGSKPPHILSAEDRKKMVEKKEMFIDIGTSSKDEVKEFGIRPGDPILPDTPFTVMANPKMLMAKAWDNRAGCYVAAELLRSLQGQAHPNTLYSVATVQEEVGLRGATTSTELVAPDVGLSVDVGIAGDTPGTRAEEAQSKMGKGPAIVLYDASMIPHLKLRNLMIETAEAEGIPYQFDAIAGGGTDAGKMHTFGQGVPSLAIAIPSRYIHSHASIINLDDLNNTVRLLSAVVKRLDRRTVETLKQG